MSDAVTGLLFNAITPPSGCVADNGTTLDFDIGDLGTWVDGTTVEVDIHLHKNGVLCDLKITIEFFGGPWTAEECAEHIKLHIQFWGTALGFIVTRLGDVVSVGKVGGADGGFGAIWVV